MKKLLTKWAGLILLAGTGLAVAGYRVNRTLAETAQMNTTLQAQANALRELNARYPFAAPAAGEAVTLTEARFLDYIAVRTEVLKVFRPLQQRLQEERAPLAEGDHHDPSDRGTTEVMAQTNIAFIESLGLHRMSPLEFRSIMDVVYGPSRATSAQQPVGTVAPGVNSGLLGKYKARTQDLANPGFDNLAAWDGRSGDSSKTGR